MRTRNIARSVVAGLTAFLLFIAAALSQAPSNGSNRGQTTRRALDNLLLSAQAFSKGDPWRGEWAITAMVSDADAVGKEVGFYRGVAQSEQARCTANVGTLENQIADMFTKEEAAEKKIKDLEAELTGISQRKQYSDAEIDRLKVDVDKTVEAMKQREAKLEELKRYWWVPFYNLYLGIRTLVDDDIGHFNSLKNTLQDKTTEMAKHQGDWQAANQMVQSLTAEQQTVRNTHAELVRMRTESEAKLALLKMDVVFLVDAMHFWDRMQNLFTIKVNRPLELAIKVRELNKDLESDYNDAPLFSSVQAKPFKDLYTSLAAFSDSLDQGNNFLMVDGGMHFCGGTPPVTKRPEITAASPAGCPPRLHIVDTTGEALSAGHNRGSWIYSKGANYLGDARCSDDRARYYGKVNSWEYCQEKCISDIACVNWTFNSSSDKIPNTQNECWGAEAGLPPAKDWDSNFVSGGMNPPNPN